MGQKSNHKLMVMVMQIVWRYLADERWGSGELRRSTEKAGEDAKSMAPPI